MTIYAQLTNPETIATGPAMSRTPSRNINLYGVINSIIRTHSVQKLT